MEEDHHLEVSLLEGPRLAVLRSRSMLVSLLFGPEDLLIAWQFRISMISLGCSFRPHSSMPLFFSRMDKWLCTIDLL